MGNFSFFCCMLLACTVVAVILSAWRRGRLAKAISALCASRLQPDVSQGPARGRSKDPLSAPPQQAALDKTTTAIHRVGPTRSGTTRPISQQQIMHARTRDVARVIHL